MKTSLTDDTCAFFLKTAKETKKLHCRHIDGFFIRKNKNDLSFCYRFLHNGKTYQKTLCRYPEKNFINAIDKILEIQKNPVYLLKKANHENLDIDNLAELIATKVFNKLNDRLSDIELSLGLRQ